MARVPFRPTLPAGTTVIDLKSYCLAAIVAVHVLLSSATIGTGTARKEQDQGLLGQLPIRRWNHKAHQSETAEGRRQADASCMYRAGAARMNAVLCIPTAHTTVNVLGSRARSWSPTRDEVQATRARAVLTVCGCHDGA